MLCSDFYEFFYCNYTVLTNIHNSNFDIDIAVNRLYISQQDGGANKIAIAAANMELEELYQCFHLFYRMYFRS